MQQGFSQNVGKKKKKLLLFLDYYSVAFGAHAHAFSQKKNLKISYNMCIVVSAIMKPVFMLLTYNLHLAHQCENFQILRIFSGLKQKRESGPLLLRSTFIKVKTRYYTNEHLILFRILRDNKFQGEGGIQKVFFLFLFFFVKNLINSVILICFLLHKSASVGFKNLRY